MDMTEVKPKTAEFEDICTYYKNIHKYTHKECPCLRPEMGRTHFRTLKIFIYFTLLLS